MANNVYFNSRSKALEIKILDYDKLVKLVKCSGLDDIIRVLNDWNFLQGQNIQNYSDLLKLIDREEQDFLEFLKRNSPNEKISTYFLLKYDYHNLEYLYLKNRLNVAEILPTYEGKMKIDTLEQCVVYKNYRDLSSTMQNCLNAVDKLIAENKSSGFLIDTTFKKALYQEMVSYSKASKLLAQYTTFLVNLKNIELALRFRDQKLFDLIKLDGGSIEQKEYEKLCNDDFDKILRDFKHYPYFLPIQIIISSLQKNQTLTRFEFMLDCLGQTFFDELKFQINADIPYLRYCFLKINELVNLRIVFEGFISNRNKKKIINELRRTYEL